MNSVPRRWTEQPDDLLAVMGCLGIAAGRSNAIPGKGRHPVHRQPLTIGIQHAEIILRQGIALLGRAPIPVGRLAKILHHALAILVQHAKVELRLSQSSQRGAPIQAGCYNMTLHHAQTTGVKLGEIKLRPGMLLLGRPLIPASGLGMILRHTQTLVIQNPKVELGLGLTLNCQRLPVCQCQRIITPDKRRRASGKVGAPDSRRQP